MRIKFICAAIALSIGVSGAKAENEVVPTLFDYQYYAANNPDVVEAYGPSKEGMIAHYKEFGWKEGRKGYEADTKPARMKETAVNEGFDYQYYKANNPDVVEAYGNSKEALIAHYSDFGFAEGRLRYQGDIPWKTRQQADWARHISTFDYQYYAANNPDVVEAYGPSKEALIAHYKDFGLAEGRSPNKENTAADGNLLATLYITKYHLFDDIANLSENAIKVYIKLHKATRNGFQDKAEFEEAAKIKAAEEKTAVIAKVKADEAAKKKAAEEDAAQETKEDSSYILTNESLMEMFGDLPKQYQQLANIKNIKIEKLIDQTKMKTINSQGITRTMYCKPCTLGSPMLQSNSTGLDMGFPKVIHDGISEALIEVFDGENPLKKSQIIKLGISSYKEIAKTINDPNINKAMAMPAEQLKQIKTQQRKTQASSQKKSGGSAEGHDHHHEEEGPGPAPGDPGDHYSSGIGG